MPDLKDKYSDAELDRSNKAFDEIVNHPDMRALDDQGDAVARDLNDSENAPGQTSGVDKDGGADSVKQAEEESSQDPDNRFNYQKTSRDVNTGGWSTRRKLAVGGGVGTGVVGAILAGFMMLTGKIPGIMQMISNEAGQRVEQVTEKRAKMIVGRYILRHSGVGVVLTGKGPVSTLMASMRTNNFEKKLAAKGLKIQRSDGGVKLLMHGETLGNGQVLRNETAVVRALESNRISNKMLNDVIKEEIPSWRWMKRAKFAKWLRIKYGIPRYGIENSNNPDEEARLQEMEEARLRTEYEALATSMGEAASCIMTADCDVEDNDSRPAGLKESGEASAVGESASGSVDEVVQANSESPGQGVTKTLMGTIIDKLGTKAIPIIGWIDLVATVDHLAYESVENDYFGKIASYYRAQQYARHYGLWSGYGSQVQLGAMDPAFIGVLAKQTEGVEESQAFNMIEGNPERGVPVSNKINANQPGEISKKLNELQGIVGGYDSLGGKATHTVLNLYYQSIGGGGLLGWASEKLGDLIAGVTPDAFTEWAGKLIMKVMGKLFEIMGLDFDPAVKGADWFNAAHGGATWTHNDFCKTEMGCRKLTPTQTALQNSSIAADRELYRQQQGLAYQLFNPENTTSLTTQLAIHTPTSVASLFPSISRLVSNTPATLLGLTTSKSSATTYVDIHGVDPYGALAEELNQPVDPRAISGEACDDTADGKQLDLCKTDTMVAEAMLCEFEPESEDCAETDLTTGTGEGIEFTVGSYNILHSDSHTDKSKAIGGCNQNPVPGDPTCAKTRGAMQVKIITGQEGAPQFDIFGTQETSADQYNYLKDNLSGYDVFPENTSGLSNSKDGAVAIFWNTEKFNKVESGKYPGLSNTTKPINNPWVGLQAVSGQKVYVTSIHYAVTGYGGTPENIKRSSQLTMDWVKTKASGDSIVIVLGDFNDKLGQKLHYCIYTEASMMQHAVDMEAGADPGKGCTANRDPGIDHIYATPTLGITASKWTRMAKTGIVSKASDHAPVYTIYTIPGSGGGGAFNIASFNIFHIDDGESRASWLARLRLSLDTLTDNQIDIAGLQEVRPGQLAALKTEEYGGSIYDIHPKATENPEYSPNPIIWNKSKFKLIKTGSVPFLYFGGANDKAPLVKLEDIDTGQQFYVVNTHDPADARGPAAELRYKNALKYAEIFKDMAKEGLPIFFTGDFNSGYAVRHGGNDTYQYKRENLTYCILTDNTSLWDAYDAVSNKTGKCPTTNYNPPGGVPSPGIDHIFLSTDVKVSKYWLAAAGKQKNGSDVHPTVMASITMPGEAGAGAAGSWAWPVDESGWKSDGPRWLESHFAGSDAWTNSIQAASDINIGSQNQDCGKPVYSMISGKIVANPPGYTMQVESTINGKKVLITYAHGRNMKQSGTVKSGDKIMEISNNSSYGGTCHLHLEIKYGDKAICPQDVFPIMGRKQPVNLDKIPAATRLCG